MRLLQGCLLVAWLACPHVAQAELYVWVDGEGRTHVTDQPGEPSEGAAVRAPAGIDELRGLWQPGALEAEQPESPPAAGERSERILNAALDDLRRGETARGAAALEAILRQEPRRPEPHYYLALVDRERGRFASAEAHLRVFLAHAGDDLEPLRRSAERRLRALEAERRLVERGLAEQPLRLLSAPTPNFLLQFDAALAEASPDYASRVLGYLEEARRTQEALLGVAPSEPTGVVLYGRAAYRRTHGHRFSFETVGFYDGRIHVVSAAHPAGELRALLFHEYTHALFSERTGGHRPFWLNEGLAELAEQRALGRPPLTRSDRSRLRSAIEAGQWIPLRRLARSFGGLRDGEARLAYLQATAAAEWIEGRSSSAERAHLLERLGRGEPVDRALASVLDLDTEGVERSVQQAILAEFPAI